MYEVSYNTFRIEKGCWGTFFSVFYIIMSNLTFPEWFGIIGTIIGNYGFIQTTSAKKILYEAEKVRREEYEHREELRKEMCQRCEKKHNEVFSYFSRENKKEMG